MSVKTTRHRDLIESQQSFAADRQSRELLRRYLSEPMGFRPMRGAASRCNLDKGPQVDQSDLPSLFAPSRSEGRDA